MILRNAKLDTNIFFESLHIIEKQISHTLLRNGSLFKCIVKDSLNNSICMSFSELGIS